LVRKEVGDRTYGSGSATLVALGTTQNSATQDGAARVRYDFTAHPATPDWAEISTEG
jgi:hypothetical protein